MKIELHEIAVKDVYDGYHDFGADNGVVGYDGKLNIRPKYQRNFVYNLDQSKAVMNSVIHGFPLNVMYWVVNGGDSYEVLDGQQRTLSVMQFLDHKYPIELNGQTMYVDSLPNDVYDQLMNYKFMIYWCQGTDSEKLDWFRTVNIAGEKLTDQELRNIAYTGPWLSDAKKYFSKRNCAAKKLSDPYAKGDPNRQELLELALKWIADAKNTTINDYMALHKSDDDANSLWQYFQHVIHWIQELFPDIYKQMKGQPWGLYYNQYHTDKDDENYNSSSMSKEIKQLMDDPEVTSKRGIWLYELAKGAGEPNAIKNLSLRTFDHRDAKRKYDEQTDKAKTDGTSNCPYCTKEGLDTIWKLSEMQADHIIPWSRGGKTEYDNLQMLCKKHNESKGNR